MQQAWLQADLLQDVELAAFLRWRCEQVTALVADIVTGVREKVSAAVAVKVIATCQRPHSTAFWEGMDLAALARVSDGLELPLYQPSASAVSADLQDVMARLHCSMEGDCDDACEDNVAEKLSVILRPGWPDMTSEAQLNETYAAVKAAGIQDIAFYNYGMLRPMNRQWLQRLDES